MSEKTIEIDIAVDGGAWPSEDMLYALSKRAVLAAMAVIENIEAGQTLSLLFANDDVVQDLNARFRNQDKPTNVLSFPGMPMGRMPGIPAHLGDIALSFETIFHEAEIEGKTFKDHLTHLVVHGVLHLAGYDHEEPEEAVEMENLERIILRTLAISDPYA